MPASGYRAFFTQATGNGPYPYQERLAREPVDRRSLAALPQVYAFARVSAVVGLNVQDYFPLKKRWWLRLREKKNGKVNEMGCHHKLEQFLDEYITGAGIADDKGPLFPAAIGRTDKLSDRPMSRVDAWYMVRRRARDAGIEAAVRNQPFRATGVTDYLKSDGSLAEARKMASHADTRATQLYDRRGDVASLDEYGKVGI
ncbi:MAG: tyrosine-type recombinase/integrase [Terriglobia bacterium]